MKTDLYVLHDSMGLSAIAPSTQEKRNLWALHNAGVVDISYKGKSRVYDIFSVTPVVEPRISVAPTIDTFVEGEVDGELTEEDSFEAYISSRMER